MSSRKNQLLHFRLEDHDESRPQRNVPPPQCHHPQYLPHAHDTRNEGVRGLVWGVSAGHTVGDIENPN